MAGIFFLSAQPGQQSYELSAQLAQQIQQDNLAGTTPGWFSPDFHANLRKWAHVWLYFLLAISTALTVCSFWNPAGKPFRFCTATALLVCLVYSISDELHQFFVPGRACLATDVLVDALGFVPGILLVCWLWYRRNRRQNQN